MSVVRVAVHAPVERLWSVLVAWAEDAAGWEIDAERRAVRARPAGQDAPALAARIEVPRSACMTGPAVLVVEAPADEQALAAALKRAAETAVA